MVEMPPHTVPTRYWRKLGSGRIECTLCPRLCHLKEGQRGLCFVRMNLGGEVVLTSYGLSTGFCIDPIEKKPLHHFLPGTPVLSFGTAGCNLACRFCQNWDISKSRETATLSAAASPEGLAETAQRLGCRSVAYTYNDPVVFHEYALDVARECRKRDIRNVAVTAGYVCAEPRAEFYRWMDAVNVDLKAFTDRFYRSLTGARLEPVLETLRHIRDETEVWLEITTLLIPGENDSAEEIERLCRWVVDELGPDVPLHFSAFHPAWKMLETPPTPLSTLRMAHQIAREQGVRYPYTGNAHDLEGGRTLCHQCGAVLIARDGYRLLDWGLRDDGLCGQCGTRCAGHFEAGPGDWGSRRRPVQIDQP